jgi:hypothetical protein
VVAGARGIKVDEKGSPVRGPAQDRRVHAFDLRVELRANIER